MAAFLLLFLGYLLEKSQTPTVQEMKFPVQRWPPGSSTEGKADAGLLLSSVFPFVHSSPGLI
jgi:hypothetical protein